MAEKGNLKLLSELRTPRTDHVFSKCKLSVLRADLEQELQDALDNCVELIRADKGQGKSKTYSVTWLHRVLMNNGYSVSVSTIQRHVNKGCACERIAE